MSDFQRHPTTGAPFIADPTTGKRRQYGRASSATKDLDDDTQLQKWIQRRAVLGATVSDEVFEMVADANRLFELDSPEWKKAVDEAVELALTKGKARIAAERGTYAHSLVEADEDDGKLGTLLAAAHRGVSEEDVRDIINGGLVLEVPVEAQQEIIDAWRLVLEKFELEVLTQEHRVVADRWRLAGTLDAIFRLGKDLTFRLQSGELITLNKGDVICGDLKGLAVDTLIPTPSGWTTMGAIAVGDKVYGRDGHPHSVTAKSAIHSKPCYLITFDNTDTVVADHDHIWVVSLAGGREVTMTTEQMSDHLAAEVAREKLDHAAGKRYSKRMFRIHLARPLQNDEVDLPIDPYVLGCWLGDGHKRDGCISKPMPSMWEEIERRGYAVSMQESGRTTSGEPMTGTVHGIRGSLNSLGLLLNKHIPEAYLRAGFNQRLDLLRGLMDTDGSWNIARNAAQFSSTDKRLAESVHELVCSLGMRALHSRYNASGFGKVVRASLVSFTPTEFNPFLAKHGEVVLSSSVRSSSVCIKSIERIPTVPTQCISVDSPDHTYLFGRSMIPTHNTGRLRIDGKGMPMFWDGYCGQVTAYANSVPYEPATDSRGEWPAEWGEMSSDWAIIVHISVEEVLSGEEATAELILVDLNQGIKDLDLARQIKDSRKASRFGVLGPSEPVVVINSRSKDADASASSVVGQPIDLGEDW